MMTTEEAEGARGCRTHALRDADARVATEHRDPAPEAMLARSQERRLELCRIGLDVGAGKKSPGRGQQAKYTWLGGRGVRRLRSAAGLTGLLRRVVRRDPGGEAQIEHQIRDPAREPLGRVHELPRPSAAVGLGQLSDRMHNVLPVGGSRRQSGKSANEEQRRMAYRTARRKSRLRQSPGRVDRRDAFSPGLECETEHFFEQIRLLPEAAAQLRPFGIAQVAERLARMPQPKARYESPFATSSHR